MTNTIKTGCLEYPMQNQINAFLEANRQQIINLTSELIKSHNPHNLEDTRPSMKLVQDYLACYQLSFTSLAKQATMPNLVTTLNPTKSGRKLLFNGHLDCLPVGNHEAWSPEPFSGAIKDGKIFGRGSADMKAGVVAMLVAYTYLSSIPDRLNGQLSLMLVSDEETGWGRGSYYVRQQMPELKGVDGVLLAEPTHPETIAFSSKGYTEIKITVNTSGAIAGYENLGTNAIVVASNIIQRLQSFPAIAVQLPSPVQKVINTPERRKWYEKRVGSGMANQLKKTPLTVSKFQAGDSTSMIPSNATFKLMMVTPQNVNRQNILARLRRIINKYPGAKMNVIGGDDADISVPGGKLYNDLHDAILSVSQIDAQPVPEIAISDARYWRWDGIPAFWYGFNGETVGMANEYIEIDQLFKLIKIYILTAINFLKGNEDIEK